MDEQLKQNIIDDLSKNGEFVSDKRYSVENRKWFIKKIIEYLLSINRPESVIHQEAKNSIKIATDILKLRLKKGFKTGSLKEKWSIYSDIITRTQVIYDTIAMHPDFLSPQNHGYLDFIIERRFRTIKRMIYYVPEDRNIFAYPYEGCLEEKVNKDAAAFWNGSISSTTAILLNNAGKADPVKAIESIFYRNRNCDRNIFYCGHVATILHMDSLLEARNKGDLIKKLVSEGEQFLKIDHPTEHFGEHGNTFISVTLEPVVPGSNPDLKVSRIWMFFTDKNENNMNNDNFYPENIKCLIIQGYISEEIKITAVNPNQKKIRIEKISNEYTKGAKIYLYNKIVSPPFHFISDTRSDKSLFEQVTVKLEDIQVGDHIYVTNHPLYYYFYPRRGVWGGEHSFITEIGSRDIKDSLFKTSLKVAGHGLDNNTILGMSDVMLNHVNTVLSILQSTTQIHLKNIKEHGTNNSRSAELSVTVKQGNENNKTYLYFEYETKWRYYDEVEGGTLITKNDFVIRQEINNDRQFNLYNMHTKDSKILSEDQAEIFFIGSTFNNITQYEAVNWGVKFFDDIVGKYGIQPLFEDGEIRKSLTTDDLNPLTKFDETGDVFVTRPKVNFDANYQTYLKSIGAY
ncbi:MAG: hypothetical protein J5U19_07290 [Candidatus Methanoperedens sp.]|nr:hypothetical protein [Candidatus Methanoperedens sp.]